MTGYEAHPVGAGKKPALLIVDVINGFTDPQCPLGMEAGAVVSAIKDLLEAFRARSLPVYYTTVIYDKPEQAGVFRLHVPALNLLEAGTTTVEVDSRIPPLDNEPVLAKHYPSAFFKTELASMLENEGVDTLYVTGLTTSGCVRASAVDALQHDLRVIIPREGVGDWDLRAHESNLHDLGRKYADVVTLQDAIEQLPSAS